MDGKFASRTQSWVAEGSIGRKSSRAKLTYPNDEKTMRGLYRRISPIIGRMAVLRRARPTEQTDIVGSHRSANDPPASNATSRTSLPREAKPFNRLMVTRCAPPPHKSGRTAMRSNGRKRESNIRLQERKIDRLHLLDMRCRRITCPRMSSSVLRYTVGKDGVVADGGDCPDIVRRLGGCD